jgi:hypothetical protein
VRAQHRLTPGAGTAGGWGTTPARSVRLGFLAWASASRHQQRAAAAAAAAAAARRYNQCWLLYDNPPAAGGEFPRVKNRPTQEVGWLSGVVDARVQGDAAPREASYSCACKQEWRYDDPSSNKSLAFKVTKGAGGPSAAAICHTAACCVDPAGA